MSYDQDWKSSLQVCVSNGNHLTSIVHSVTNTPYGLHRHAPSWLTMTLDSCTSSWKSTLQKKHYTINYKNPSEGIRAVNHRTSSHGQYSPLIPPDNTPGQYPPDNTPSRIRVRIIVRVTVGLIVGVRVAPWVLFGGYYNTLSTCLLTSDGTGDGFDSMLCGILTF